MLQKDIHVGWFAFEGEKFSPTPRDYSNCLGIVAWVNPSRFAPKGKRGLILLSDAMECIWSDEYCNVDVSDKNDGWLNTQKLLAYGATHNVKFPAAEWCCSYIKNGVKKGQAFLPAVYQLKRIMVNCDKVNDALSQIGAPLISDWCWSSSSYKQTVWETAQEKLKELFSRVGLYKWSLRPLKKAHVGAMIVYTDGVVIGNLKSYRLTVRAVMSFKKKLLV